MKEQDIRWQQRLENFEKALSELKSAIRILEKHQLIEAELNNAAVIEEKKEELEVMQKGLIKSFEMTWELACNVMADYFQYQGNTNIRGFRDAIKEAFNKGLIDDGIQWTQTIQTRSKSTQVYDEDIAEKIIQNIKTEYIFLFEKFAEKMNFLK